MSYHIGDTITLPPEPPIGTTIEARDGIGTFHLRRHRDGWRWKGTTRSFPWTTIAELWFPVTIIELPGESR
jgi:hypothetical protein